MKLGDLKTKFRPLEDTMEQRLRMALAVKLKQEGKTETEIQQILANRAASEKDDASNSSPSDSVQ